MANIELLIKISEDTYKDIIENGFIYDEDNEEVTDVIKNGISIPDNATNGDVIKSMFPNITIKEYSTFIRVVDGEEYFSCSHRWWNAPYQKVRMIND